MNDDSDRDDSDVDEPLVPLDDEDGLAASVDGEAMVVPGQRPGPTEPTPL